MAPLLKPMLGDLELQQVQEVETDGEQVRTRHEVPALEGDFLQGLGRRGTRIHVAGVLTGPESSEGLGALREKYHGAEPVSFVSDIASATQVEDVVIEDLAVRELAGKPERFAYALTLREYTEPPAVTEEEPPEVEPPPPPDDAIDQQVGTLVVEVVAEGQPGFDMSRVTVNVAGTQEDQTPFSRTLTERNENVWTADDLAAGDYTVEASASASAAVAASAAATVQPGAQTQTLLTLRPGSVVARAFVIHFHFNNSFIEPCMRPVLRQVAARARQAGSAEKLLIVGHTDKVDREIYNQSLSERRARSAHAFLTFGRDAASRAAAVTEWTVLRQRRTPGQSTSANDTWGIREYQLMLQDLGFYPGAIDGIHGDLTDDAVRAFRCQKGLPPGTQVDPAVWQALIEDYLAQDSLAVPEARFFRNAKDGCDGGILRWLGCGELSPLPQPQPTRHNAHRPYRRVEVLFVDASAIPCDVKQPDTFLLPPSPGTPPSWCLDPNNSGQHCCFGTRDCSAATSGQWCIQPAEPGTLTAQGTLRREDTTPFAHKRFVLIAPDGQIMTGESFRGEPQARRTDGSGSFSFPNLPVGVYTLEVREEVLARLPSQSDAEIRGRTVCKALRSPTDRLDVVISSAPVLREIRLPVAAHLMTALHPLTREVRTCPDPSDPARRLPQRTRHTPADVRGFFEEVNDIWRQARVRFELVDIVEETYAFRTECEVDINEFGILLERCAYPNVVNVFFLGDIGGATNAGYYAIVQAGGARQTVDGCAVSDRFLFTVFTPPLPVTLSSDQTVQVLAHKLGDFLGLEHVTAQDRLMLATTQDGSNRKLVASEVTAARKSCNARFECQPLSLRVTGATRVGGTRSHEHIVIQNPTGVVTVDAVIPAPLVAPGVGTLTVQGGNPGASPTQRTVSTAATAPPVTEIEAVYTPAGGAAAPPSCVPPHVGPAPAAVTPRLVTRAVVRVVTFDLTVDGRVQNRVVRVRDPRPGAVVTVVARINPAPFCVPRNLVAWTKNGAPADPADDPLRLEVSRNTTGDTVVGATLAGVTRTVTITIGTFSLRVEGAIQVRGPASNEFAVARRTGTTVKIVAVGQPPEVLALGITWTGGTPGSLPEERLLSAGRADDFLITATVDGVTESVIIHVMEVRNFTQTLPVGAVFDQLSNANEPVLRVCDTAPARLSVDIHTNANDVVYTTAPAGIVDLNPVRRTGDGEVTIQPRALPAGTDVAAGRETRFSVRGWQLTGPELTRNNQPARVRIRQFQEIVAFLFIHIVRDDAGNLPGTTLAQVLADLDAALTEANRLWGQACIRFRRTRLDFIDDTSLLDISATVGPGGVTFPDDEDEELYGDRNTDNPTFINVYLIDQFIGAGNLGGAAGGNHMIIERDDLGPGTSLLAHELGHNLGLPDLDTVAGITALNQRLMRSATPRGEVVASGGVAGDETLTARQRALTFTGGTP